MKNIVDLLKEKLGLFLIKLLLIRDLIFYEKLKVKLSKKLY